MRQANTSDNIQKVIPDTEKTLKAFHLALGYALACGTQEDVADALRVRQSAVSRWARRVVEPQPRRRADLTARLARFISRRSRKVAS